MRKIVIIIFIEFFIPRIYSIAQSDTTLLTVKKHRKYSVNLKEERAYWVSLPANYSTEKAYPVIYVLDAEWGFNLVESIVQSYVRTRKVPEHIIVGIPHIDMSKRTYDLTFSDNRIKPDGSILDDKRLKTINYGGGRHFLDFLNDELLPDVAKHYSTNNTNILLGHSFGGYFALHLLLEDHDFQAVQVYDPSVWFNEGELIDRLDGRLKRDKKHSLFISRQIKPDYHCNKIDELVDILKDQPNINLEFSVYEDENHGSMFIQSVIDGLKFLYWR
jgi:hypothetical protein